MAVELSKTQITKLGDRLREGAISEADLRLLDLYRRLFSEAYEFVVETIRRELKLEPTGRPAKSTTSISDKLRRESIRLPQIQDIAGCRLIVPDIASQESVVQSLESLFEQTTVIDRREKPSHGYRAVHVLVNFGGKVIEVQVRTSLQQLWAELSEKFSDVVNPAVKYGGGDELIQSFLRKASDLVAKHEFAETQHGLMETQHKLFETQIAVTMAQLQNGITDAEKRSVANIQEKSDLLKLDIVNRKEEINLSRQYLVSNLSDMLEKMGGIKGGDDGISN